MTTERQSIRNTLRKLPDHSAFRILRKLFMEVVDSETTQEPNNRMMKLPQLHMVILRKLI